MISLTELGRRVKHYRDDLGLGQEKLAELADTQKSTISNVENAKIDAGIFTIMKIADGLGISVCKLVGEEDDGIANAPIDGEGEADFFELESEINISNEGKWQGAVHEIDGVYLQKNELDQIMNFARFLVLQRDDKASAVMKKITEYIADKDDSAGI